MNSLFLPRGSIFRPLFAGTVLIGLALLLVPAMEAAAQEKSISLYFTKELLYNIARDNDGQMTEEIVNRLLGLSPSVADVDIIRTGGDIILAYTVRATNNLPVHFRLVVEKMAFYRMAAAREDVAGMLRILKPSGEKDPLISDLSYRYDDRYSIIQVTLDLGPVLQANEERMAKAAAAMAPTKPPAPKKETKSPPREVEPTEPEFKKKARGQKDAEPKKRAFKKEPPVPQKRTFLSVASLAKTAPPEIDGRGTEPAWKQAEPFSFGVTGDSGAFHVSVTALRDREHIYFLVRWPDRTAGREHRPWVWSKEENAYLAGKAVEDALAMQFARKGKIGDCMLAGRAAEADLWFWRAARTNPVGFAEDATMKVSLGRIAKANSYQAKNKRTVWIKESRDSGTGPYSSSVAGTFAGEKVERYIPRVPAGSAADVRAKATWSDGGWTLEMKRRLATEDEKDVEFTKGEDRYFSVAVYDGRERDGHSTSREHLLKLE